MTQHEQAVVDAFNRFLSRKAQAIGRTVHTFALDGQDRDTADYLLTDEDRFALIEFKYGDDDIRHENRKPRRLRLCKLLDRDAQMKKLHDQCHFIAWMQSPKQVVQLNVYRYEVCNCEVFGSKCGLVRAARSSGSRVFSSQFADELFGSAGTRSLSLAEFESYLRWLMSVASQSEKTTLEIVFDDDSANECRLLRFDSVREVHTWFHARRSKS